jgi:hypothetical protein
MERLPMLPPQELEETMAKVVTGIATWDFVD